MRAAEIFERWYVATVLEPAVGRGRAIRRMAELAEIRDRLLREATIAPTADVLDLGCAYGLVTWPAGEEAGHAFGADPDPALIAAGMTVPATGATLLAADPDRLPLPAASFDVVLWRGTLARRPAQAREILGEAFRVLRPEGRLCFAEPAPLEARPEDPAMRDLWARRARRARQDRAPPHHRRGRARRARGVRRGSTRFGRAGTATGSRRHARDDPSRLRRDGRVPRPGHARGSRGVRDRREAPPLIPAVHRTCARAARLATRVNPLQRGRRPCLSPCERLEKASESGPG